MDDALLEMDQSDVAAGPVEVPTGEEADALLRDDPPPDNLEHSPTSAVKAAIEAKITEEMTSEISHFETTSKLNATTKDLLSQ